MGLGVPPAPDPEGPGVVVVGIADAEGVGVEATVWEVGRWVRAPKPVVFDCVVRVSSWIKRFAVSAVYVEEVGRRWRREGRELS